LSALALCNVNDEAEDVAESVKLIVTAPALTVMPLILIPDGGGGPTVNEIDAAATVILVFAPGGDQTRHKFKLVEAP
jgi:hypothetical protein